MQGRDPRNAITSLAVLTMTMFLLASCDPPEPPVTLDGQQYRATCTAVPLSQLGGGIPGVTASPDVWAVRRIGGVDPRDAFAIAVVNPDCPPDPGDWLLVHHVDLSRGRVKEIRRLLRPHQTTSSG